MGDFQKLDSVLEGPKKGASSLLPAPVSPAWLDPEIKKWYGQKEFNSLTKNQRENLTPCVMLVHYSPTGRASCRRCGEKIEQGQLRFGYPFRWRESEDCYSMWLHPECYASEVFGIKEKELSKKIFGYEALNNTERARLCKAMKSTSKSKQATKEAKAVADDFSRGTVGPGSVKNKIVKVPIPKQLKMPMLPFQHEGMSWMCHQEDTAGGGILADEMGMGKTLQAIALMLARPVKGPCLVVCPMAAVPQWKSEIERFTAKGAMKVLMYHGQQKARLAAEFRKVDVVLTTYQTLECDYRREMNKGRVTCKWCGKMFQPDKLAFHQRYFCGPDAIRTAKQQKTDKKHQVAAKVAMTNMGISNQAASSSSYSPPTITNIYKDYMKQAGVDVKANGYWNVMREANARARGSSSSSSAPPPRAAKTDGLNRERLTLLSSSELKDLAGAHGLDKSGRKPDLVDRLMDFAVTGKAGKSKTSNTKVSPKAKAKAKPAAKAKAVAKNDALSKLKPRLKLKLLRRKPGASTASMYLGVTAVGDKWRAKFSGKQLGTFKSELEAARAVATATEKARNKQSKSKAGKGKQVQVNIASSGERARTVGNARNSASSSTDARGKKRKQADVEEEDAGTCSAQTYEGPEMDLSGSPLHCMKWSRIILDEAHRIKGRVNSTAMAAYALQSSGNKWCLTGTPIQNRVGELYSLIRFLRVRPYAFYYCNKKGCKCECARVTNDRYCPNCGHVRFMHYSHFRSKISSPIIKYGYMGAGMAAFRTLRHDLLDNIMLRRTKEERKKDLQLPPIKVTIRKDKLSKEERDFYSSLFMQSSVKFGTYVSNGTVLHNYAHIFDLLTSLRRAVDHPYLIVYGGAQKSHKLPPGVKLPEGGPGICGLCQDDILEDGEETKREAKCGHCFHDECIRTYLLDAPKQKNGGVGCPVCFTNLQIDLDDGDDDKEEGSSKKKGKQLAITTPMRAQPKKIGLSPAKLAKVKKVPMKGVMQKVKASEFQSSTKIEALVDEVEKMRQNDKAAKAIVFSQFGVMLELVEFRLKRAGISCVVFRGGMTMQARQDALVAFNTDPTLKVILISLKAGGEGLNLQVANHVFLLDPWWNPACELQAIQRAHRIGQTKPVKAVRFITAGTIEEKIIHLQEKKQLVFDSTIDGSASSMMKLTEQDLRFLFQQ